MRGSKRWIAIAAVIALAGCGGGSDDAASTTTTAKEASTTTTEAAPKSSAVTDAATLTAADMGGDWVEYPDKATRDAANEKMTSDPEAMNMDMPFDAPRMFWGGFEQVVSE